MNKNLHKCYFIRNNPLSTLCKIHMLNFNSINYRETDIIHIIVLFFESRLNLGKKDNNLNRNNNNFKCKKSTQINCMCMFYMEKHIEHMYCLIHSFQM